MNRSLTGIIIFFVAILIAQENVQSEENIQDSLKVGASRIIPGIPPVNGYPNGNGNKFVETGNRLPQLLRDVKVYLSDAVIADVHKDTLEVIYNLDRIFNLLTEADQLGEMTAEDQEEFNRYEASLIDVYTHRLTTLQASDIAIQAEEILRMKKELNSILAKNTGQTVKTVEKDTDRDNFLSAKEALAYGLVDEVLVKNNKE